MVYALSYFNLFSEVYDSCKITVLMNTMSQLIAAEGVSELTARLGGSAIFFFPEQLEILRNGPNQYVKGQAFGKMFAMTLDYHI